MGDRAGTVAKKPLDMNMGAHIVITPETHWDREWYLPFQEYRAKLVLLMNQLIRIFREDPDYKNFTLDGQAVPLEDYLEVHPEKEDELKKYISQGRLSVGPMYILPDMYLVSGEAVIRNLLLGHRIANKYGGKVMKAGYIPDPFGHFAQTPQILSGFDIPSMLFARGFGDEFEKLGLNMEFIWDAPGKAASVIGIHLIEGYGSVAGLDPSKDPATGLYQKSMDRIMTVISKLSDHIATKNILLNNGSDHLFPQPHVPAMIKQWNAKHGKLGIMEQADFETYVKYVIDDVKKNNIQLKHYEGELHGGRYQYILSGVFSARMWIKQWNKLVENRLERYTEPFATIAWMYDTTKTVEYPQGYIWTGWKWLLQNHPHDSICGCSVDYIHDMDMRYRFGCAEQISTEIFKNSAIELSRIINSDTLDGERIPIFVYNPHPRKVSTTIKIPMLTNENALKILPPDEFTVTDSTGKQVYCYAVEDDLDPRYMEENDSVYSLVFVAQDLPPLGIKTYYVLPGEKQSVTLADVKDAVTDGEEKGQQFIENKFYKVITNKIGSFDILDKETNVWYKNQAIVEDGGDWGDEYDFSGPDAKRKQKDTVIYSNADTAQEINRENDGITGFLAVTHAMMLPVELNEDRTGRDEETALNIVDILVSINSVEKKVFFDVAVDNKSKDHRLRLLFSSGLKSDKVDVDGHFYVDSRPIDLPKTTNWEQAPVPTHHENNFVSVSDGTNVFTVVNEGLPEYEPMREKSAVAKGTVNIAITLLRSIGWLSRGDFATRKYNAGPALSAPGAQCLDEFNFSLGIVTGKGNWLSSNSHIAAEEFTLAPQIINPVSLNMPNRMIDVIGIGRMGVIQMNQLRTQESAQLIEENFSACELKGDKFLLSSFKHAEYQPDKFIVRLVNMADTNEKGTLILGKEIISAEIVNLNEQKPTTPIKATIVSAKGKKIEFSADPHVIFTILIKAKILNG